MLVGYLSSVAISFRLAGSGNPPEFDQLRGTEPYLVIHVCEPSPYCSIRHSAIALLPNATTII
jgi:hypothetical protein